MKMYTLPSGDTMPAIGLGTWRSPDSEICHAVTHAVKHGYRHLDCASFYLNEGLIGRTLSTLFRNNLLSRDEIWVTSKLWNSFHAPEAVPIALKSTLSALELDYLDLYLVHWPVAFKKSIGLAVPQKGEDFIEFNEAHVGALWEAMEALVDAGLVKNIGVSNFGINKLKMVLKTAKIRPSVNQIECHPYLIQPELNQFCEEQSIHITAYSPLGSPDRPSYFQKTGEPALSLLENDLIRQVASTHQATPAQVLIAWQLAIGHSTIPKSVHVERIDSNFRAENLTLSDEDVKSITALNQGYRYINGESWELTGSPYKVATLWE